MNTEIYIVSAETEFPHMLELELRRRFRRVSVIGSVSDAASGALLIIDIDSVPLPEPYEGCVVCYSRSESRLPVEGEMRGLLRPFRTTRLIALCESLLNIPADERQARLLGLDRLTGRAIVEGVEIALTDCELRLFAVLLEARGEPLGSDELIRAVWGESEHGRSLLPVYIHYLRKKLESDGKKLIYAHRGGGYSIPAAKDAIL